MKSNNWRKVSEILVDCLEIETSKRPEYLNSLNLNDELRREVETLLELEADVDSSLNLSAVDFSTGFFSEDDLESAAAGQQFGAYEVIGELGYGGMGAVYLAKRTDGKFEQKVALKILKREMNTAAIRRRFEQERNILASLEHPNIARLLNAGTTYDKIPYIAMEYVEGLPIDDYCSQHNLNLNQRLDLFREVCTAVDFAHRNLIVHRDLKPSNILVTKDGKPKLLDFGISKILSEEIEHAHSATITKLGVMTPSYASPEQIQSKSVTTATDIYSLGVILYELLSGHRPFETKEQDLKEIYKAIIEDNPPLPSSMVKEVTKQFKEITESKTQIQSKPEPKSVVEKESKPKTAGKLSDTKESKTLHTKPQTINLSSNSIRGDLDNIVLKALRKEPERRYSSAENFAEDIKRHLRGLPVNARPNTFSYRAEKFVKRNKASVFAGGFIILAIIGGIVATLWQAKIAQAERAKAEKRFNDVRKLANSFLFKLSPKIEKLPGSTAAREELVKLALEYLDSLSKEAINDPELQRELAKAYEKVGDVQGNPLNANIGDVRDAAKSYEKALSIRQNLFEKEPENLDLMSEMADIYLRLSEIKTQVGTTEEYTAFHQKALALREKLVERKPNDFEARKNLAIAISKKGTIVYWSGNYKESVKYFEQARVIYEQLLKEKPADPQITENLGYAYIDIGGGQGWDDDLAGAERSLQKGLDILVPLAEKYPNDSGIQQSLMSAYRKKAASTIETGDLAKTEREYRKALEIGGKILTIDPQNVKAKRDVAGTMRNLASTIKAVDIFTSAGELLKEVKLADPQNPWIAYEYAITFYQTGELYQSRHDDEAALRLFEQAKGEIQKALDLDPNYVFAKRVKNLCLEGLGDTYAILAQKSGKREFLQKSLQNYQQALDGFKKMKSEGNLGEYDGKIIPEIEDSIKKVESKLGK